MAQVKTYRVLHGEGLKVGDSVRMPGELIPEAGSWPNVDSYLAARHVEIAFVDQSELNKFKEGLTKTTKKKANKSDSESSESHTPKKRVAKKTVKKTVKKGVKKSGLAEQSV